MSFKLIMVGSFAIEWLPCKGTFWGSDWRHYNRTLHSRTPRHQTGTKLGLIHVTKIL